MSLLKGFSQLMDFLVELSMFFALGYVGYQSNTHTFGKYVTAVGLPLIATVLWGIFAAPRSNYRLDPLYRSLFALILFGITALLVYKTGHTQLAITFAGIALVSELLTAILKA